MNYAYNFRYVETLCGTTIPLKMIESMKIIKGFTEEDTFLTLKGDVRIECVTLSGKEYVISMITIIGKYPNLWSSKDVNELSKSIEEKWMYCVTKE